MAGHVPKRILHHPEVHKCLLEGTVLFKSDDVSQRTCDRQTYRAREALESSNVSPDNN